ncbi:MAG: TonB family protein [Bacteroidaceae bacterium]|nr:TonB family protein [Bacteroidaceae bacterium]
MGSLTLYAIKSSLTLALLYLPYTLLMRRDTLFRMNRAMLLAIAVLSLVVPCLDLHIWDNSAVATFEARQEALREITLPTLVVSAEPLQKSPLKGEASLPNRGGWVVVIYVIGMLAILVWKAAGLVRLARFIPSGCLWTDQQEGATIYCHAGQVSPFSWMRSIVINEGAQGPVMQHELAHVRLGHSWDILLLSLVEALQWFNPCVWMLDASLREVHEYEADDAVLRRGISAREYQLLLIEKAVVSSRYPMVNSFNHSLLKNRITMMTKPRTPKWARLKVLYAVPLTLLAVGAFASGQLREMEKPIAGQETAPTASAEKKVIHAKPGTLRLIVDGKEMTEQEAINAVQGKEIQNTVTTQPDGSTELQITASAPDDDPVVDVPDKSAEFPDSLGNIYAWMSRNINYPKEAQEKKVEGRVSVQFIIEKDGSINEVKTLRSPDSLLTAEAERVVKAMPKWEPAMKDGKPVRMRYVLPVLFKLPSEEQIATIAVGEAAE